MNKAFLSFSELNDLDAKALNKIHREHLLVNLLEQKGLSVSKSGHQCKQLAGVVREEYWEHGLQYVQTDENRQSGRTTQHMLDCVGGSLYFWSNDRVEYAVKLAEHLGRIDLQIYWVGDLRRPDKWHGREIYGVEIDHACELSEKEREGLSELRSRVRGELP